MLFADETLGIRLGGRPVLHAAGFKLASCEFDGLVGSNGAGKSTRLRVLVGLVEPIIALDPAHQLDAMALLRGVAYRGAGVRGSARPDACRPLLRPSRRHRRPASGGGRARARGPR